MTVLSAWLDKFPAVLDDTFPQRVWFAGIQGSYARGEATDSSDIDPVAVLDTLSTADIRAYSSMLDALPTVSSPAASFQESPGCLHGSPPICFSSAMIPAPCAAVSTRYLPK